MVFSGGLGGRLPSRSTGIPSTTSTPGLSSTDMITAYVRVPGSIGMDDAERLRPPRGHRG
jgi:hypothetical protein